MNYCIIIPDRGDRPTLLNFCYDQIRKMQIDNWNVFTMSRPTINNSVDIVPRVREGVVYSKDQKYDEYTWAFIIENDDFYPATYIKNLIHYTEDYDFIGYQNTTYYNIKTRRYQRMEHETHSSLFCTGFRISALDDFQWPPDDNPFLDIALWKHAKQKHRWKLLREENPCVGIKGHGMGKMGGKGHRLELNRADPDMKWFRAKLNDEKAFEFYKSIV